MADVRQSSGLTGGAAAFRALAESTDECAYLLDPDGRCAAASPALGRWLGRPEDDIVGRTVSEMWPPPAAEREADQHRRALGGERVEEEEDRPRGRQWVRARVVKVLVRDDSSVLGVLGLVREVGAAPASRTELLGRLAAGVVHDFRHLLSLQLNHLALLQAGIPPGTDLDDHLRILRTSINQGAALTERLLMLVGPVGPRLLDVNAACAETAEVLRHIVPPRVTVQTHLRLGLPPVRADAAQLTRLLLTLCFNACEAMPRGGDLILETEWTCAGAGDRVVLHVRDTGEGMLPEVRAHVFEPFFSTRAADRNVGMGLTVAADVVRRMGGRIECRSSVGAGTTFTVRLPPADPTPGPPEGAVAPSLRLAAETVLVVDPEPSIVRLAREVLQRHGYRVLTAEDGRRAVEACRRHAPAVDVVVVGPDVPGSSGLETMSELLAVNPQLRLLLMTDAAEPEPAWAARMPGCRLLPKPWTAEQLVRAVRELLGAEIGQSG